MLLLLKHARPRVKTRMGSKTDDLPNVVQIVRALQNGLERHTSTTKNELERQTLTAKTEERTILRYQG